MMITYTVLDDDRNEIIGFVEAPSQREACARCYEIFNSPEWDERFQFLVSVGDGLCIRPHDDPDPYFSDHNAVRIDDAKTYRS